MNFYQSFEKSCILTPDRKKTSNLLQNNFKRQIEDRQWTITKGIYVHKPMVKFLPPPKKKTQQQTNKQTFSNIDGFRQNNSRVVQNYTMGSHMHIVYLLTLKKMFCLQDFCPIISLYAKPPQNKTLNALTYTDASSIKLITLLDVATLS